MFRFEHPGFLYLCGLVLVLAGLQFYLKKKQVSRLKKLAGESLWPSLVPGFNPKTNALRSMLWLGGIFLIILALSNPQWGVRKEKVEIKSTDIYLALDISNSMLAEDIKPSRLERAKLWSESLIMSLAGDRIGTILFAGNAFLQSPLTQDYGSATMFIRSAYPDLISTQGTNLQDAIQTGLDHFSEDQEAQRVILILSDGEDHEDSRQDALAAAAKAREKNVALFTIGVGTEAGGLIPIKSNNLEDYKRDETGRPITTRLQESVLKELAETSRGKYYSMRDGDAIIPAIKSELANMEKQRLAERSYSEFESYFPYFLFPGLILLVFEFLLGIRWFDRFKKTAV